MTKEQFMESAQKMQRLCHDIGRKAGCSKADVEELYNDALGIAWNKSSEITSSLEGYIITVFNNCLRKFFKKKKRQSLFQKVMGVNSTETDESTMSSPEMALAIRTLITRLAPLDMAVIQLVLVEKYSYQEASQELGIGIEALRKRLTRAKQRARTLAEEMGLAFTTTASEPSLASTCSDGSDESADPKPHPDIEKLLTVRSY